MRVLLAIFLIAFALGLAPRSTADAQQSPTCFDLNNCGEEFGTGPQLTNEDIQALLDQVHGPGFEQNGSCMAPVCVPVQQSNQACRESCDRYYDGLVDICFRMATPNQQAICLGTAAALYGSCLAACG